MQVVAIAPGITVAPAVGSLAQCVTPLKAAGAGAAIVLRQRSSLNSQSSIALPRQGSRLQPLRAMRVPWKGPAAPLEHSYLFDEGDQVSVPSDASTSSLLSWKLGGLSNSLPLLPKRQCLLPAARSYNPARDGFLHVKFFERSKRPKWWWRTLSCLPYLLALHKAWMYAEHSYYMYPFLADFEFLINPYLSTIGRLPGHVLMAYTVIVYLGVVRRKNDWPYFFRFHVILGMLLDMGLDIFLIMSSWMPLMAFWGKPGMVLWMATTSVYVLTVLECIRNALAGTYADISFLSETAFVQTQLQ